MEYTKVFQVTKPDNDYKTIEFYRLALYGALTEFLTTINEFHISVLQETENHNEKGEFTNIFLKVVLEEYETPPKAERIDA